LREILEEEHSMPFLMSYLKEMKNESIELMLHPICAKFLDDNDSTYDDLSELSEENLKQFKILFCENKQQNLKGLSSNMDLIIEKLIDLLAKKVPAENVTVNIDAIHHKIKLVATDGTIEEDYTEKKVTKEEGEEEKIEEIHHKANIEM